MNTIKPVQLSKGDTIGIVSVAAPEADEQKERFARGLDYIKNKGYNIKLSKHVKDNNGYITSSPENMAKDLMDMYKDETVKCILCAGGGLNANSLLQYLDLNIIKNNPKIFVGVSNPTVLLNAINAQTGLITFHGPAIVWDFGEENGLCSFTDEHLWKELSEATQEHEIRDDNHKWKVLKEGSASGRLIGGNLISIQTLIGTKFEPNWNNSIFIWEDICKSIEKIDLMLTHFKDAGAFDKITGMIIGELVECTPNDDEIYKMILDRLSNYQFPIIANVPFGHTQDKLTLPIGATAHFDTNNMNSIFIDEASVLVRKK